MVGAAAINTAAEISQRVTVSDTWHALNLGPSKPSKQQGTGLATR